MAAKFYKHMVAKLADKCRRVGRNLTLEAGYAKPSDELLNLWNHQVEMSEMHHEPRERRYRSSEPHRAVMLVMADRLDGTVARDADMLYTSADELLDDLRVVQRSLAAAGAERAAYGPVQTLIWQVESFGFHMVEMEFRQHSLVHDPRACGHSRARHPRRPRAHDARGARYVPCDQLHPEALRAEDGAPLHHLVYQVRTERGRRLRAREPGVRARVGRAGTRCHPAVRAAGGPRTLRRCAR